jgi:diguanylate cyclase (GGDEF)-like protein
VLDNERHHAIGMISVIRDITEQKLKNDLLQYRAEHDSLIDIYNRHTFIERVDQSLCQYTREASLIFFDLDDFKNINDQYGHMAGDYVLKKVCSCIKKHIGSQSMIGRMGGEEFAVFFEDRDFKQSLLIAEQLRKKIEQTRFQFGGKQIDVTVSIGIAGGRSLSFAALYQEAGKNCVRPDPASVA